MKKILQSCREVAEIRSRKCASDGNQDSADAWERVGIAIDELLCKTRFDFRTIEERRGLFNFIENLVTREMIEQESP